MAGVVLLFPASVSGQQADRVAWSTYRVPLAPELMDDTLAIVAGRALARTPREDGEHDSLWNGVLIGAGVGVPVTLALSAVGGDTGGTDWFKESVVGAVLGAAVGLMIDAARTGRG